jgi:hypothetical protein
MSCFSTSGNVFLKENHTVLNSEPVFSQYPTHMNQPNQTAQPNHSANISVENIAKSSPNGLSDQTTSPAEANFVLDTPLMGKQEGLGSPFLVATTRTQYPESLEDNTSADTICEATASSLAEEKRLFLEAAQLVQV